MNLLDRATEAYAEAERARVEAERKKMLEQERRRRKAYIMQREKTRKVLGDVLGETADRFCLASTGHVVAEVDGAIFMASGDQLYTLTFRSDRHPNTGWERIKDLAELGAAREHLIVDGKHHCHTFITLQRLEDHELPES